MNSLDPIDRLVILLDADCKIHRTNKAARRQLRIGDGISERGGKLHLSTNIALKAALTDALAGEVRAFSVYREQAGDSIDAVLSTAPRVWAEGRNGLAALVMSQPGDPSLPSSGVLREQYGLTEAEARFALQFIVTKSISGAAAALGISTETARRHIKAVFEKSGTHSQNELTQLLLLHPHAVVSGVD